ncbi:uncharacterized protein LOC111100806 isoform X1 [Crassostrea virginica]|uniref:Uncharacterized protein LOC111100806 n=1 Tax=Crassostrea virginica TaxID=6565 RepID=A0A8B8AAX8_CRAVI|nr:uncharacterized protein LOC111100806 [Crassostrea virginica]
MDFLADSQQSQELFQSQDQERVEPLPPLTDDTSDRPIAAVEHGEALAISNVQGEKILLMLSEILKEQKSLREELSRLNQSRRPPNEVARVEGSPIEKEYVTWLKDRFSRNPWICFKDPEVQDMLSNLIKKAGWKGPVMGILSSFGSTKFTYYRNQIRAKMMGNKEVDVEGLAITSLHNYLWKCFLPPTTMLSNPEREHLTLMLRSFCATNKLFRKGGSGGFSFWPEFKDFYTLVMDDKREDKWEKLAEKEEKRIRKYLE